MRFALSTCWFKETADGDVLVDKALALGFDGLELGYGLSGEGVPRIAARVKAGEFDCAFTENGKLVIVDYKTDREPPDALRARYQSQLETYRNAMRLCTGLEIGGVYLYSFHNHCEIVMDDGENDMFFA